MRLELGLGTPPSPFTQLTISQDIYTSNIVTIPVVDPTVQTPVPTSPTASVATGSSSPAVAPAAPTSSSPLSIKNSASFAAGASLAPDMIAFAEAPAIASQLTTASPGPWPSTLSGVSVQITDSQGQTQLSPIYFAAPTAIGFLIPANAALGAATIKSTTSTGATFSGTIDIARVAPGLYTAKSSGSGVAAGFAIHVAGSAQTQNLLFDPASTNAVPVDLGVASDQVFLSLYGTGFRNASSATATVGGVSVPVSGFAAVTQYQGLDVVNVGPLPRSLEGHGEVSVALSFDGKPANAVTATIQ